MVSINKEKAMIKLNAIYIYIERNQFLRSLI